MKMKKYYKEKIELKHNKIVQKVRKDDINK
jgi:hypothetical protein